MKTPILKSRRLWTAVITLVVNVVTFIVAHYVNDPVISELLLKTLLPGIDVIAGILIAAFTVEDVALIKSDYEKFKSENSVKESRAWSEYENKPK